MKPNIEKAAGKVYILMGFYDSIFYGTMIGLPTYALASVLVSQNTGYELMLYQHIILLAKANELCYVDMH